jgi:phosphatidylethanolamine/phosphatidyl-N-methylethanolamine N-methyltransferase
LTQHTEVGRRSAEATMPILEGTQAHQSKLYYEFSHLYDRIFARVFYPRIAEAVRALSLEPGARVLEVGVGTGLSLPAYPSHCHVVGVDLAPEMLERAQEKVDWNGWRHVQLMEMDALNLKFEDSTFDYVMAFHVVSVVPDAQRLMEQMIRVAKPEGTIVVINHFRSRHKPLAALDSLIEPITRKLGWQTLGANQVFADPALEITRQYKTSQHSLFNVVVCRNRK